MTDVVIVGGGAAGMAAAVSAAIGGARVVVLEKMDRVGKKLLATGNGRCNLMNDGELRYPGSGAFARAVLEACGAQEQKRFWKALGLRLRTEEGGRVYPVSGQASTVLDTLRLAMDRLGVEAVTGAPVDGICRERNGFAVRSGEKVWRAGCVIAAGGGCAQPKLGSDGSVWPLMVSLGHRVLPPRPALTQIITGDAPVRGLAGIRVKAEVTALRNGKTVHQEAGEVLFADYGISGICVMGTARYVDKGCELRLNLLTDMGFTGVEDAQRELLRRRREWSGQPMERLMTGLCVPHLASALCQAAGILWKGRTIGSLTDREASKLARTLHDFTLPVKGVKGFESAQVTAGGLDVRQFCPATMESTMVPGLYAAGEVLNVDGDCGGFNLMFAFGSGIIAGRAAAASLRGGNQ